jgi:hypothetical protein
MIIELIIHIYQILKENNKIQKNQIKNHNKKYTNNNNNIMDFNHGKIIQILMIFNNDFFFISYINLFIFI